MKLTEPPGPVPLSRRRMRTGREAGDSDSGIVWHLGYLFTEHWPAMEITRGVARRIDHAVDASHLFVGQFDCVRNFIRLETVVLRIKAEVHAVVGQREIKLLLRLVQRIGVCCRRPLLNLLWYAKVCGQLIDL